MNTLRLHRDIFFFIASLSFFLFTIGITASATSATANATSNSTSDSNSSSSVVVTIDNDSDSETEVETNTSSSNSSSSSDTSSQDQDSETDGNEGTSDSDTDSDSSSGSNSTSSSDSNSSSSSSSSSSSDSNSTVNVTVGSGDQCTDVVVTSNTSFETEVGEFFSYTMTASGDDPIDFSVTEATLPDGLTFDGVDTISGTPTAEGTFAIDFAATNSCSQVDETLTLTVSEDDVLGGQCTGTSVSASAVSAEVGEFISYTLSATGSDPVDFIVATSTLPEALEFDGVDTISGTTTTDGTFAVSFTAKNSCSSSTASVSITVSDNDDNGGGPQDLIPDVTISADPDTIEEGATSTLSWIATGGDGALSCDIDQTIGSVQPDASTSVSPQETTTYTITCEDEDGDEATDSVEVIVNEDNGGGGPDPEPPIDQCLPPFEANDQAFVPGDSGEKTLQAMLDDAGFSLDVEDDQKDTEIWNPNNGQTTDIEVEYLDGVAAYDHVFGYYINGDTDTFTPLFESGDHSGFSGLPVVTSGDTVSATVPAASQVAFAINIEDNAGNQKVYSTDTSTNSGHDNAAVYLPLSGGFVIAFEDLRNGDDDFNDLVVNMKTTGCDDVEEEEPQPEIGYCPLETKEDRIIVDFSTDDVRFRSDQGQSQSEKLIAGVSIPAGTYDVTLVGADAYDGRQSVTQPNESYFAELISGTSTVAITGNLLDIADGVDAATSTTLVSEDLELTSGVDALFLQHAVYPDTSSPNSLTPVCAAFDEVDDGNNGGGDCDDVDITSATSTDAEVGEFVSYTLTAEGDTPIDFDVATSTLPDGFTFDGTDTISGTTTSEGDFVIDFTASNDCSEESGSVTLSVSDNDDNGGGPQDLIPDVTISADPDTIEEGATSTLSWIATGGDGALSCDIDQTIGSVQPDASTTVSPQETTTYTITCEDEDGDEATDSVEVIVNEDNGNGGGNDDDDDNGGGGTSSGGGIWRGGNTDDGEVLGATTIPGTCSPLITEYLRMGQDNNPQQVRLLQAFLQGVEGADVEVTGFFDEKTDAAVREFQLKYAEDVLEPWGITESTGYVYYTTQKKINEIYCDRPFPLTSQQSVEIEQCKAKQLDATYGVGGEGESGSGEGQVGQATSTSVRLALDEENATSSNSFMNVAQSRIQDVAAAAFVFPNSPQDIVFYGLWLILILAFVYILGSLVAGINSDESLSLEQLRMKKILYFMVGTLVGLMGAVAIGLTLLIVPLIVVIIALAIGLLYYARKTTS